MFDSLATLVRHRRPPRRRRPGVGWWPVHGQHNAARFRRRQERGRVLGGEL